MPVSRFEQDAIDLRQRFKTEFMDVNPTIRVIGENLREDVSFPVVDGEFVTFKVRSDDSVQASMGSKRTFRHIGIVSVGIHTEVGKGTERNAEIADLVANAMGNVSVGGIVLRAPRYRVIGAVPDRWFQGIVTIPWVSSFTE